MIRRITVLLFCVFYLTSCAAWFVKKPQPQAEPVVVEEPLAQPGNDVVVVDNQPGATPAPPPVPQQNPVVTSSGGGSEPKIITCAVC